MSYHETIKTLAQEPEQMEQAYRAAVRAGEGETFRQAIDTARQTDPDNLLLNAWYYRLRDAAAQAKGSFVQWGWVLPLALLNGLLFWWLSDESRYTIELAGLGSIASTSFLPTLILLVGPLAAVFLLLYLTLAGRRRWQLGVLVSLLLLAAAAYVLLFYPRLGTRPFQEQYLTLMAMHLPLLAWAGIGAFLLAGRHDPDNRFAFLIKSLEVFIMGGLLLIAGGLFTAITVALFSALAVDFPETVLRLFIAGGGGLIPLLAVALIYNPTRPPAEQSFDEGLSKLIATLMRILLPLTLLVLLVYVGFILFNFREPFDNRDVLIIYNAMLFAVVALLVGATPITLADTSGRLAHWLRWAIIAVAALALLVSLYALAAIVYRTALDRLTPNRMAFIGWNLVNIGLLSLLLLFQVRARSSNWLHQFHRAFSIGMVAYAVWTMAMIVALPWLFGVDRRAVEALPPEVQELVYQYPDPILLKCAASPHIYLLEDGDKRWIDTIATFNDRGYAWRDVRFVPCDVLRGLPDGTPIPADSGPPPQP